MTAAKQHQMLDIIKLEKMPLWKEANELAEYMYGLLDKFSKDEEWHMRAKLHNAVADFVFYAGLSLSNVGFVGREHDWANFRKMAGTVKTVYRFAARQNFVELNPDVMVRLDKLLDAIDERIVQERKRSDDFYETVRVKELKPWQEKYNLWLKINEKNA